MSDDTPSIVDLLGALQRAVDAARAERQAARVACTCEVGICREDDEDGCCESEHCPATGAQVTNP